MHCGRSVGSSYQKCWHVSNSAALVVLVALSQHPAHQTCHISCVKENQVGTVDCTTASWKHLFGTEMWSGFLEHLLSIVNRWWTTFHMFHQVKNHGEPNFCSHEAELWRSKLESAIRSLPIANQRHRPSVSLFSSVARMQRSRLMLQMLRFWKLSNSRWICKIAFLISAFPDVSIHFVMLQESELPDMGDILRL